MKGLVPKGVKPWCSPGVCEEKANYPGDPGGYRVKREGVRSKAECRGICNKDPVCCHWVHYGPDRGKYLVNTAQWPQSPHCYPPPS